MQYSPFTCLLLNSIFFKDHSELYHTRISLLPSAMKPQPPKTWVVALYRHKNTQEVRQVVILGAAATTVTGGITAACSHRPALA
jgi:hypothetical protein